MLIRRSSGILRQYYGDRTALDSHGSIIDFPHDDNNSASFKCEREITGKTGNGDTNDVEIIVSLKYLINFWRTLEMPLINCEISWNGIEIVL